MCNNELKANLLRKIQRELPEEIVEMIFAEADDANILEENEVTENGNTVLSYLKIEVVCNECDGAQSHKQHQLCIIEFKREYMVEEAVVVKTENIIEDYKIVFTSIATSKYLNI